MLSIAAALLIHGYIVMAPEVHTFEPCGAPDPLWVDGEPEVLVELRMRYQELAKQPYERTFAVLEGRAGGPLDCGFCEDYEGSFRIERVALHRRVEEGDCRDEAEGPDR